MNKPLLENVCNIVNVPVIAFGGAGKVEDFITLFKTLPKDDAGLAASVSILGKLKSLNLKRNFLKKISL